MLWEVGGASNCSRSAYNFHNRETDTYYDAQVIEIEPKNEDAYIGCCELLKADGKNLEAVAVYCKYGQTDFAGLQRFASSARSTSILLTRTTTQIPTDTD